ncbi:MAG: ATP-grasp domain-containing protein [Anaerovibrio sp.]|uniref:ATP-grasp domain-containing protein n=1 Tax=Anaerovibrio sp. TaxID=1872532 RepID=UPI0025F267B6|nr:ATP-grasp domain-containing protein [Anaerovibrio sp.]MCR5176392.1 ATP-grasp domain-containing protein [Anaerovibrio sp.]
MSMENIVVVDPLSTGENYINDIIQRGFRPICLWSKRNDIIFETMSEDRNAVEHHYHDRAEFLIECDTYEKTLGMVKEYAPKLIVIGGEVGVELATKLAADLRLPGNPIERIPALTNKHLMNQALIEYGIRGIRGTMVHNWEEIITFYREQKLKGCVLKPYRGAGSFGVRVCENEEELKDAFNEVFSTANAMGGEEDGMLLQEKIEGTEYVVNTISCNGMHKLSSIWKYAKKTVEGGGKVYSITEFLEHLETGSSSLVRYAFEVLKALGVTNGIVHSEFMIDEKGPVLIEANCRVIGNHMSADYMDRMLGHHETDLLLDAYLHPDAFAAHMNDPYRPLAKGFMKNIIVGRDMNVVSAPILSLLRHQKSFYGASIPKIESGHLDRTIDLATSAGVIYFVNGDYGQLHRDRDFIERIESGYFDMLFSGKTVKSDEKPEKMESIEEVISRLNPVGTILLLSNEIRQLDGVTCVSVEDIEAESDGYAFGIFDMNYRENEDYNIIIDSFFRLVDKVRNRGCIIVPERSCWHLPCGRESIEIMSEAAGLLVEAPAMDAGDTLIIRKIS